MSSADIARVRDFYAANPDYFLAIEGEESASGAARDTFEAMPPAGWSYDRKIVLGFTDGSGTLVAVADLISNLFADGVWHVGLFIVATRLHGSGAAKVLYDALEAWMKAEGAQWLRLGVVVGNARAERFWERMGYVEVRKRHGVTTGKRVNDLRVMVKALDGATLSDYLARVDRDRRPDD